MARPSEGTDAARVWALADRLSTPQAPALRADVVAAAIAEGVPPATASTQFHA